MGPLAGYSAPQASVPLTVVPVPAADSASLWLAFDISMGVRRDDVALRARRARRHRVPAGGAGPAVGWTPGGGLAAWSQHHLMGRVLSRLGSGRADAP